jgi:hypothetical protein
VASRPWRRFTTAVEGPGAGSTGSTGGWVRLADRLADPAALDAWVADELAGTAQGHRDLAGSLIVYRYAGCLADLTMGPLLGQRRAFVLTPEHLYLTFAENARIDAVGLRDVPVAVLPDDPAATRPEAVVAADPADLYGQAATGLVAVFEGLAAAVRARAPFGSAGIWGTLADHLGDVALRWSRESGVDAGEAWAVANAVIDGIAAHPAAARLRARPRRDDVTGPTGAVASFATRGTCCLIYKVHEPAPGEPTTPRALIDAAACTSCPLRPTPDRHALWSRRLA